MTQELHDLRQTILEGRTADALFLLDALEDMSRKAILDAIQTFLERMVMHLIKNHIEQRMTNSWASSIRGSLVQIGRRNQRDHQSWYIRRGEWSERLEEAYEVAIADASVEAPGGMLTPFDIQEQVDRTAVLSISEEFVNVFYDVPARLLPAAINDHLSRLPGGDAWRHKRQGY